MTLHYRMRAGQDDGCRLLAHYEIDGKVYCDRHAGSILLAYATKQAEI
jgi:hypothetical protein